LLVVVFAAFSVHASATNEEEVHKDYIEYHARRRSYAKSAVYFNYEAVNWMTDEKYQLLCNVTQEQVELFLPSYGFLTVTHLEPRKHVPIMLEHVHWYRYRRQIFEVEGFRTFHSCGATLRHSWLPATHFDDDARAWVGQFVGWSTALNLSSTCPAIPHDD
jgi:hypothetical protein